MAKGLKATCVGFRAQSGKARRGESQTGTGTRNLARVAIGHYLCTRSLNTQTSFTLTRYTWPGLVLNASNTSYHLFTVVQSWLATPGVVDRSCDLEQNICIAFLLWFTDDPHRPVHDLWLLLKSKFRSRISCKTRQHHCHVLLLRWWSLPALMMRSWGPWESVADVSANFSWDLWQQAHIWTAWEAQEATFWEERKASPVQYATSNLSTWTYSNPQFCYNTNKYHQQLNIWAAKAQKYSVW